MIGCNNTTTDACATSVIPASTMFVIPAKAGIQKATHEA
jgi:hypothetical protein